MLSGENQVISCDLSRLKSMARTKLPLLGNFKLAWPGSVGNGQVRAEREEPNSGVRQAPPSWCQLVPAPSKELKLAGFSELSPCAEAPPRALCPLCPRPGPDGADAAPRPLGKGQAPPGRHQQLPAGPTSSSEP